MRRSTIVLAVLGVLTVTEIWLLGAVGSRIGVGWMLLILMAEAALGAWLIRREGTKAWASLSDARDSPDALGAKITDAALVLVGGLLLMLPGFVTDIVGLFCLIPATRGLARRGVSAVMSAITRPYRDQADLLRAKIDRDSVVQGETVEGPGTGSGTAEPPTIIRGEIEP